MSQWQFPELVPLRFQYQSHTFDACMGHWKPWTTSQDVHCSFWYYLVTFLMKMFHGSEIHMAMYSNWVVSWIRWNFEMNSSAKYYRGLNNVIYAANVRTSIIWGSEYSMFISTIRVLLSQQQFVVDNQQYGWPMKHEVCVCANVYSTSISCSTFVFYVYSLIACAVYDIKYHIQGVSKGRTVSARKTSSVCAA